MSAAGAGAVADVYRERAHENKGITSETLRQIHRGGW